MKKWFSNLLHSLDISSTKLGTKRALQKLENIQNVIEITQLFDFYHIPNLTIQLKSNQLPEITLPAIAHCQTEDTSYFVVLMPHPSVGFKPTDGLQMR